MRTLKQFTYNYMVLLTSAIKGKLGITVPTRLNTADLYSVNETDQLQSSVDAHAIARAHAIQCAFMRMHDCIITGVYTIMHIATGLHVRIIRVMCFNSRHDASRNTNHPSHF